jgi:hypothetical protein
VSKHHRNISLGQKPKELLIRKETLPKKEVRKDSIAEQNSKGNIPVGLPARSINQTRPRRSRTFDPATLALLEKQFIEEESISIPQNQNERKNPKVKIADGVEGN